MSFEYNFSFITLADIDLMVILHKSNLENHVALTKMLSKLSNPWYGKVIVNGDCVDYQMINTHALRPIFH